MMAPTVVLRDGEIELGLGSAGSNRIRSAILQTIVRAVEQGMARGRGGAGAAPALRGRASSRPSRGSTRRRWRGSRRAGSPVLRRPAINLFFGGVQAVARDPRRRGALSGGGDPRRGGGVAVA